MCAVSALMAPVSGSYVAKLRIKEKKQIIGNDNIIYHPSKTQNQIREGRSLRKTKLLLLSWAILSSETCKQPLKELGGGEVREIVAKALSPSTELVVVL